MAKKATTPGLRKALAQVDKLGRQMTREADADYAIAAGGVAAGQQNLSRQTRALTRDLLLGNKQNAAAIDSLRARAAGLSSSVAGTQSRTTSRYGSALGESVSNAFAGARGQAAAGEITAKASSRASLAIARTAGTVAGIAQAGVKAQGAAAAYSLNQALQQRAIVDNQTLAQLTGDLYSQAIQYNTQLALYERQRADARRDAKKAEEAANTQLLDSTVSILTSAGPKVYAWLNDRNNLKTDPETGLIDITATLAEFQTDMALNPTVGPNGEPSIDSTMVSMATVALQGMRAGDGIDAGFYSGLDTLYSSMEGWDAYSLKTIQAIITGGGDLDSARRATAAAVAKAAADAAGSGGTTAGDAVNGDSWLNLRAPTQTPREGGPSGPEPKTGHLRGYHVRLPGPATVGSQVRDELGNIGFVEAGGQIKWLS